MDYKMTFDYHTHTVYSHGKGTIRENVLAARECGLKGIAVADHGPGHMEHGLNMSDVPEMRRIITDLNKEFDDIDIFLSIEANIIYKDHGLDVREQDLPLFDFVIAGYHYGLDFAYYEENWKDFYKGYHSRSLMIKNTQMITDAIYKNNLKILTHPGDRVNADMAEIAKACEYKGTWIEISTQHVNPTDAQLKILSKADVKFVISSDAHLPEKVGHFEGSLKKALEAGIEPSRIVNIERV